MQRNDLFLAKMNTLQSCQCPSDYHGTYVSCLLYILSPLLHTSKFIVLAIITDNNCDFPDFVINSITAPVLNDLLIY